GGDVPLELADLAAARQEFFDFPLHLLALLLPTADGALLGRIFAAARSRSRAIARGFRRDLFPPLVLAARLGLKLVHVSFLFVVRSAHRDNPCNARVKPSDAG